MPETPNFRLASEMDAGLLNQHLVKSDLVTITRIEEAFGREPFSLEEAIDVLGEDSRASLRRLRNARALI